MSELACKKYKFYNNMIRELNLVEGDGYGLKCYIEEFILCKSSLTKELNEFITFLRLGRGRSRGFSTTSRKEKEQAVIALMEDEESINFLNKMFK